LVGAMAATADCRRVKAAAALSAAGWAAAASGRLVAGRAGRDDVLAPSAALRADTRKPRALAGLDEALEVALADGREGDVASLSAEAVAIPSEVPTPRKSARAPTRPMYLEYPAGAFSVRVDGRIAPPPDHGRQGDHLGCGGHHRRYSPCGRSQVVLGRKSCRS
jgi:hypothetical protein